MSFGLSGMRVWDREREKMFKVHSMNDDPKGLVYFTEEWFNTDRMEHLWQTKDKCLFMRETFYTGVFVGDIVKNGRAVGVVEISHIKLGDEYVLAFVVKEHCTGHRHILTDRWKPIGNSFEHPELMS